MGTSHLKTKLWILCSKVGVEKVLKKSCGLFSLGYISLRGVCCLFKSGRSASVGNMNPLAFSLDQGGNSAENREAYAGLSQSLCHKGFFLLPVVVLCFCGHVLRQMRAVLDKHHRSTGFKLHLSVGGNFGRY